MRYKLSLQCYSRAQGLKAQEANLHDNNGKLGTAILSIRVFRINGIGDFEKGWWYVPRRGT